MYMKILKIITSLVFISVLSACDKGNKDAEYLNGEVRYINQDSVKVNDVTSKSIHIENQGYGMFSVYDSLVVFWNIKFPHHFFCIYNVDTENEVGFFCNKGRGHNEFSSVAPVFQFFKIGHDLKTTICDGNNKRIYFWNISQSISQKTTIYDTIISYNKLALSKNSVMDNLFYQPDDTFLARINSLYFIEGDTPLPYYKKWGLLDGVMDDYHVYKNMEMSDNFESSLQDRVYSVDAIKPDGSKVVQALNLVPQINIIDTKTGKITSYRISDVSRVSLFNSKRDDGRVYYNSVQADDNYIYATYWGDKQWDTSLGSKCPFINIIHVFNWEGKMLYKLKTDRMFFRIALDPIRNSVYTSNLDTDEMYYIDLNGL